MMNSELFDICLKYAAHLAGLCGVCVTAVDVRARRSEPCGRGDSLLNGRCHVENCSHLSICLYGIHEAYRWNGRYIFYCPAGLVFVASPVTDSDGSIAAGLVAGPLVMGNAEDSHDFLNSSGLGEFAWVLPLLATARVNDLAEVMAGVTTAIAGRPHSKLGTLVYEQDKVLAALYSAKDRFSGGEAPSYPIETERQLQRLIAAGDKAGSRKLLNELLGHIYFAADYDPDRIRARVLELVIVLSRATIDAGADSDEILWFNTNCLREIYNISSIEDFNVWVTGVMHRFIDYSFDFTRVKHSDIVYKVMEYVKQHCGEKITLNDISCHVYMSRSYLSRIFKDETGESLSVYISRMRVERSKAMLLDGSVALCDIANLSGFADQSYFTKVFKKITGVSPKKYRESRGVILKQ